MIASRTHALQPSCPRQRTWIYKSSRQFKAVLQRRSYPDERQLFEKAFQRKHDYMTRSELKSLVQNKKIRLTCDDDELYLVIYPDEWDVSNDVWEQITDILNELNVAMTLRKEMGSLTSYPTSNPSFLKLHVRKVTDDSLAFEDWIDHA